MATRYKAKLGSTHPDLDMLDTMWDENEEICNRKGQATAKEAARGALDFYRLKANPPASAATLRSQLEHALGVTLSKRVLKQAPVDKFDQLGQQIASAARARSMTAGADKARLVGFLTDVLTQLTGQQATGGGSLSDTEKAVKARPSDMFDALLTGAAQAQATTVKESKARMAAHQGENPSPWWKK